MVPELAVVYMTQQTNPQLIEDYPPELPFDIENEDLRAHLSDVCAQNAYQYDLYRDVLQVSFYSNHQDQYDHFIYCDGREPGLQLLGEPNSNITMFNDEGSLMHDVAEFINRKYPTVAGGMPVAPATFTGWKIYTEIWPVLVNKFFKYKHSIPERLKTDPTRRFSTLDNMLDVSHIYSQGIPNSMRRLPAMGDVLRYWGYEDEHPNPDAIRSLLCEDPETAARYTETYLHDMCSAVGDYYNHEGN